SSCKGPDCLSNRFSERPPSTTRGNSNSIHNSERSNREKLRIWFCCKNLHCRPWMPTTPLSPFGSMAKEFHGVVYLSIGADDPASFRRAIGNVDSRPQNFCRV